MKVVITGGAGFIGSRLAKWVLDKHPSVGVTVVDDLSGGSLLNVPREAAYLAHALGGSHRQLSDILGPVDVVFHFAAYAAECLSPFIRRYNYRNNVEGTAEVVNYCINREVKRLVFASSMAVYGHASGELHESRACEPMDPYGVAKLACEQDIRIASAQHGIEHAILRPHNVYGVGQNLHDKYRNVLGIWMREAYHGRDICVFGDGQQTRQFTYVDDILPVIWKAGVDGPACNTTMNIGSCTESSLLDAAMAVSSLTGASIRHLPPRYEAKAPYCTHHIQNHMLPITHETELEKGVACMWEWAQAELSGPAPGRGMAIEVGRGLPPQWK